MGTRAETVTVIVDGGAYEGWKQVTVNQSFDKVAGDATLVISEQRYRALPIKLGATIQILMGSTPTITGHVHEIDGSITWTSHEITLKIRDKTADFVDSTLGPGHEHKPPIALADMLRKGLGKMGLSGIQVIDKVNPEKFGPAEVPVGGVDELGHAFYDKWARQRQTVMNTDGKGNIVIDRNRKQRGPGYLWSAFEGDPTSSKNNVTEVKYKKSDDGRHNTHAQATQKSQNDMKHWEGRPKGDKPAQAKPMSKKWGIGTDTGVRPERRKHYRGSKGLNSGSPKKGAKWRSNLSKARGFQYSAKVQGFEMGIGFLWWPGFIIPVRDDHWEIADELFITAVKFHKDWGHGATTEVICTYNDAFSESSEGELSRTAKTGAGGGDVGSYPPAEDFNGEEYQGEE
jgi:prophage tail gpP-like protein